MANPEHLAILKQGVDAWNQWRIDNPETRPDLREADLMGLDFSRASFHSADLSRAALSRADFSRANLSEANLIWARLIGTNLPGADLRGANLNGANLSMALLSGANLRGANLRAANLSVASFACTDLNEAYLGGTFFGHVDLSQVVGLKNVHHEGPSSIGIDTIYQSRGDIPDEFLRGAGVPDQFIAYSKSLVGKAIEYYSAFISHSSKDKDFADRLFADLQSNNVRTWYAPEELKIGDKFRQRIDESIRLHDKLLLVLSHHSIDSDWVEHEVETALAKEREYKKTVLFPVMVDDTVMGIKTGWPALIKNTRHIGDFSYWKDHDAYQAAFERLLRDLKAADKGD